MKSGGREDKEEIGKMEREKSFVCKKDMFAQICCNKFTLNLLFVV